MYTENNAVTFVEGGSTYFDQLIVLIASAKETLHLQTYIYADDDTGRMVAAALIEASRRNVAVYQHIIPECTLISDDFVLTRTAFMRLRQRISFSIVRTLFFFFTFYFKQIKESEN